ncbi:MAG: transcriptional regulator [Acidobacteria bacterium]|nr:transcriptional regulator [Acidobacteriota bacterium]MBW4044680.1 transcriptional regulator [Acidobacteriota bacterium]
MTTNYTAEYLASLIHELCKLPQETEWAEFKVNNSDPQEIGEYISALSNSAALVGKAFAYLVWGVEDTTHALDGTSFKPRSTKVGNEELENWLLRLLTPKIHFRFLDVYIDGKSFVLLEIERAYRQPVQFSGVEYIRVGSYKKKLKEFPEKERALWRLFDKALFEDGIAVDHVRDDEILRLLDYPAYFELLNLPLPENKKAILHGLAGDNLIRVCEAGGWSVTNLGAILFAKRLDDFASLKRKAMRVIQYRGTSRVETIKEQDGNKGYANGFEGLIGYINGLLPRNEVIGQAIRKQVPLYPELAVRELVANALIHQDFFVSGAGPMIEIFTDRIEIGNPGVPLVAIERFVDSPPRSRNEALASLMRRIGICEERGSGWDKVVSQTEFYQLPAPLVKATAEHTGVILFAPRPLAKMEKADRIRAVYWHACLRYVSQQPTTNSSVRERFGIEERNSSIASRLIREAVESGALVPYDQDAARKLMRYLPHWAIPDRNPAG